MRCVCVVYSYLGWLTRLVKDRAQPVANMARMHALYRVSLPVELQTPIRQFLEKLGAQGSAALKRLDRWSGEGLYRSLRPTQTIWVAQRVRGHDLDLSWVDRTRLAAVLMLDYQM
jgi:hypothetical protein